jgi:hypothetical protein
MTTINETLNNHIEHTTKLLLLPYQTHNALIRIRGETQTQKKLQNNRARRYLRIGVRRERQRLDAASH